MDAIRQILACPFHFRNWLERRAIVIDDRAGTSINVSGSLTMHEQFCCHLVRVYRRRNADDQGMLMCACVCVHDFVSI
jgi:hypothetical protein